MIDVSHFKAYYGAIVVESAWYWHTHRHADQWNKIEDPKHQCT